MANRLLKSMVARYVPGVRAVAARPAYCETFGRGPSSGGLSLAFGNSSSAGQGGQGGLGDFINQAVASYNEEWIPGSSAYESSQIRQYLEATYDAMVKYGAGVAVSIPPSAGVPGSQFSGRSKNSKVTVCYVAVPGVVGSPARVDYSDNFGWNGGARSRTPISEAGYFRCTLPASPAGVMVGFSARTLYHTYSALTHVLAARRDSFTVVESGTTVFGPQALAPGAVFEVQRRHGQVNYLVNGVLVYQSAVPLVGEVYGASVLYSAADYVDSPQIGILEVPQVFIADFPGLVAVISDTLDYQFMDGHLLPILLTAQLDPVPGVNRFYAELPAMVCAISDVADYNFVRAELPAITSQAVLGLIEEQINAFLGVLPPPVLSCIGRQGVSVQFSAALPLAFAAADIASYSRIQATIPVRLITTIIEPYMPDGEIDGGDSLVGLDWSAIESALLLVAMDSLDVASSAAELVLVLELAGMDTLGFGDDASLGQILELLAMEQVAIISRAEAARQQALQYAVNYMTGALTTYRDFDFLGFTYDDGDAYAWRSDGLYRLGGEDAESSVVRALVDFGASDYGDAHLKRMATAFVGVRSDGDCYLRLRADDGPERVYKLIGGEPQKRAILAKGVRGRAWNVRLELTDASYASVDNIELEIAASQRRGYGRRN